MSNFTDFHRAAWDEAVAFSKRTGCHIMADVDEETLNKYIRHFDSNGFTTPQRAALRPSRGRWYLLAPKTLDSYMAVRQSTIKSNEENLVRLEALFFELRTTWLGKATFKWLEIKKKLATKYGPKSTAIVRSDNDRK